MTDVSCPEEGVWRTWLDEPDAEAGPDLGEHVGACEACQSEVERLHQDRAATTAAFARAPIPSDEQVERALARVHVALGDAPCPVRLVESTAETPARTRKGRFMTHPVAGRWRAAAAAAAVVVVASVAVMTPQGQVAASQFLAQFRSQKIQAVPVTPAQVTDIQRTFTQLANLGTVENAPDLSNVAQGVRPANVSTPQDVATAQDAAQMAGFPVAVPDPSALPTGVSTTPHVSVSSVRDLRFTFNNAKAQAYFQSIGQPNVQLPDRFDGATLVVHMPPVVELEYPAVSATASPTAGTSGANGNATSHGMGLLIGEAGEISVGVEGQVTLDDLRDFLLNLPGLSPTTRQVISSVNDWHSTLPIPVPVNLMSWQQTTVSGTPGLMLSDNSGTGSAVVWDKNGQIYGVAGVFTSSDVQRVAASLH